MSMQEFADGVMDLKMAIDDIKGSPTLKKTVGALLAIGNFLNGREVKQSRLVRPTSILLHVCIASFRLW